MTKTLATAMAVTVLAVGPALAGPPAIHSDSGSSERTWDSPSNPGTTTVSFVFDRARPAASTRYVAYGECERSDEAGTPRGNHRLVFKNVRLTGVDSGATALLPKRSDNLVNGAHDFVLWELAPVMDRFAEDSAVLVTGKVQVKKQIAARDILACDLGLVEIGTARIAQEGEDALFAAFRRFAAAGWIGNIPRD